MSDRLDHPCKLSPGERDAVHVPIVAGEFAGEWTEDLRPGDWVKFTDDNFRAFVKCDKADAHGVVNPFLEIAQRYHPMVILLKPGITTPVRHNFQIVPAQPEYERMMLELELERVKEEDPACADCWYIENGVLERG